MPEQVWVVIPTYNEAANIEGIVRAAVAELDRVAPDAYRILIVDDNSPDGTGQIADRLSAAQPQVEVMHRAAKTGLGHAYLAGFARALSGGAELVIEMDADFSHDPRYLGPMLAAVSMPGRSSASRSMTSRAVSNASTDVCSRRSSSRRSGPRGTFSRSRSRTARCGRASE
jgi:dolichol-phosphate mannosyltransferase